MATSPAAAATMEIDLQPASTTATPVYTAPSPALMRQPPASTRQPPAPTTMRRGATTVLLGGASRTSTPALSGHEREDSSPEPVKEHPVRQRRIGSQIIRPDSHQENATMSEETESWILYFQLIGAAPGQEFAEVEIDRKDLTFGNLLTMKSRFGYSVRDFLYYKERCGNGVAKMIEIDDELDSDGMITMNGEEREVRLVLSRDKITEQNVTITPIKLPPGTAFYEDFTNEPIDEYKDWLAKLHAEGVGREYKDMFREDTVKTYSEWLRVEGKFDDIEAYAENPSTQSSEASNPTPSTHWPAHARRIKKHVNPGQVSNEKRKFKGRGPLKGLAVSNKRFKHGTTKLNIEFSSRLEGPVGGDQRYFVDEVVVYTRKHAPLIGVRKWKDIEDEVKEQIASEIMERWDLEDTEDKKKIIWSIANESYNGWRSAFSATYRAYDSFDERMRHKPEDLHIVE